MQQGPKIRDFGALLPAALRLPRGRAKGSALASFKLWGFAMLATLRVAPVPLREFALCYPAFATWQAGKH